MFVYISHLDTNAWENKGPGWKKKQKTMLHINSYLKLWLILTQNLTVVINRAVRILRRPCCDAARVFIQTGIREEIVHRDSKGVAVRDFIVQDSLNVDGLQLEVNRYVDQPGHKYVTDKENSM